MAGKKAKTAAKAAQKTMKKEKKILKGAKKEAKAERKAVSRGFGGAAKGFLKTINPYAQTLLDPFHVYGIGIPDLDANNSTKFPVRQKFVVATNSNGVCSFLFGLGAFVSGNNYSSLIPKSVASGTSYAFGWQNNDATSTTTSPWAGTSVALFLSQYSGTGGGTIGTGYSYIRLVSAAVTFECLGSSNANSGKMSAAFFPKNKCYTNLQQPPSVADLENQPESAIVPLNAQKPLTLRYKPMDNSVLEYWATKASGAYSSSYSDGQDPGGFYCTVSGAAANVLLQAIVQLNYEAIPYDATVYGVNGVGATRPYIDPIALSQGFQEVAMTPSATTSQNVSYNMNKSGPPTQAAAPAPQSTKPMLETILESLPTVLDKGIGVAKQILPLIAAL